MSYEVSHSIPLCIMINMEVVCLILENDVALLVRSSTNAYILSFTSFYASLEHEDGHMQVMTKEIYNTWDHVWKKKNEEFEKFLVANNLQQFLNKMFHIWDDNYGYKAWYKSRCGELNHEDYHISMTIIVLDAHRENHAFITFLYNDINTRV